MRGATTRAAVGAAVVVTVLTLGGAVALGTGPHAASRPAPCAPRSPRGTIVRVRLSDDGTMMRGGWLRGASLVERPRTVPAGWVTFVASNVGTVTHELVVLPLVGGAAGRRAIGADGTIDESSSLGEASRFCDAGAGGGLAPGARGWVSLRLTAGRYELVCDVPGHYASGMSTALTVRPRAV